VCYLPAVDKLGNTYTYGIRCLTHIINLTTQALILTQSKLKYYDPHSQDEHVPNVDGADRDEVGLVRGICVKVCFPR
jgi:hypothetical protein